MASSSSSSSSRRPMHVHILYTLPPATGTTFARSRGTVMVKALKGKQWGACELGAIVKAVCTSSPNLLPNSKTDHSLFIQDPQQTARASKWADPSEHIQAIEVQPGLIGWALDDASEESKSMIVGILRKDDVDEDDEEGSDSEVEEWLEIRMRLVKAEPISHAQHLSQLSAFQQGLPFTSPPKRASASSSALAAAAPLPSSRPSHSSSLRDHPTPPTSAPASEPTPSHSLPPPPPQVFRPSPPPSSAQQQPFASTSSFHHPESEAHPTPEGPRAPKRPRVSKAATPAPEPELPKRETRRSTAKAAAAAASTPAGNDDNNGPSSSTTTKSSHPSSTPARGPPTSTPAPASSSGTNPQSTAELLSHTRSLINTTSSSGPSNSNGAGSSFSPQLLELLSKLGKDPSLTADKETVGILTSLLKAAEKEGKQQQETKGGKGKGKENVNSNPKTDAQLVKPPGGFRGTKRKPTGMSNLVDDGTGCSTCGRLKSNTWRAREGGTKVCNACGLHWNKYKVHRPKELWGDPDASPVKRRPKVSSTSAKYLNTSPVREEDDNDHTSAQHLAMTSPVRGKNGWDFQGHQSSQAGEKLKALTAGGSSSSSKLGSSSKLPLGRKMEAGSAAGPASESAAGPMGRSLSVSARKGALQVSKKDESPRKALKRMLSVGGEVELRRLKGPLSDDDTHDSSSSAPPLTRGTRSPAKSQQHRTTSNLNSGGGRGLVFDPEATMDGGGKELHPGQTEIDEDWMGSDFSTLFDLDAASNAGGMSDGGYGSEMQIDEIDGSILGGDLIESDQPSFNLQLSSDNHNELLSQTMFTSSPNSSHHSLSQSSPLALPFDFSSLPPSSPPIIPPGLFSSPPGEDEMELESPIFSILGATPTAEEVRQASTVSAQASSSKLQQEQAQSTTPQDDHDMNQYLVSPTSSQTTHHSTNTANQQHQQQSHPQDLEAFRSFFVVTDPSPSTNLSASAYDPTLVDSGNPTPPSTSTLTNASTSSGGAGAGGGEGEKPSPQEQAEFLALWKQCEDVMRGKKAAEGGEQGQEGEEGSENGTEPGWVH
ncbi:hypothetical protein BDY24DRAFT_436614 [Mrakia frigida]|uniref:uncharacterized protein n=1 Tax=Mrakia frigida TaxID=29902 RepID=UPI003FCBFF6C